MHTNIDRAISTVLERGHDIIIPNVFAAYVQCLLAHDLPEDASAAETGALAQAALVSFERAMDKYPAPRRPAKSSPNTAPKAPPLCTPTAPIVPGSARRLYSAEVARLRDEYRRSAMRAASFAYDGYGCDYGACGCTCLSCGSLAARRVQAAWASEGEDEGDDAGVDAAPVRKRRVREWLPPFLPFGGA